MKKVFVKLTTMCAVTVLSLTAFGCSNASSSAELSSSIAGNTLLPQASASVSPSVPTTPSTTDSPLLPSSPASPSSSTITSPSFTPAPANNASVRIGGWSNIEWEQYSNTYFTAMIPKGWTVNANGSAGQLSFTITSSDGKVGMSSMDHPVYASKDYQLMQQTGSSMYLENGSVQEFFEKNYASTTENFSVVSSCVPSNFQQLQSILVNTTINDYRSLYATFRENGWNGEGVYSALVCSSDDVIYNGYNYAMWTINMIFTEWTPLGELKNWEPVIAQISKSIQFTDYYYQEAAYVLGSSSASPVSDNDVVIEAFESRSNSDTIIQEKRSDMLEEYERVYDNQTGQIYRAYSGFMDDIGNNSRYSPISDQQYTEGYIGWIDKS